MSETNKSYRIRTNVGSEYNGQVNVDVNLLQDYDIFEILSLKIETENLYKYHTSKFGCVVGRVLANGGVGVPNVKISAFIPIDGIDANDPVASYLYPYSSTRDKDRNNIRYNLLTDTKINDCHQEIGTFPNKRLVLDDDNIIEIYDKYYKFTTTTNGAGDYMLFGLPVGNNIIHSDLDLSDIGFLSQKPRDMFYKGYTYKQFENASQFKKDTNLDNLTQVISQDSSVYVFPFWGDETENEGQVKIVRNDIDVNYKFEPTCIFLGCIVSDEKSNAISKNCIPHERMGKMDRLTTGAGTIEMIRKNIYGDIESFAIQGNELIDGNGTWCYQIPMNLDYIGTDEYGNIVPTDDFNKGLPTRARVRFRISLADYESDYDNAHLVKVLVPNNPELSSDTINYDYEFGSLTTDDSFRDMFWNDVYTVKSYIPRFQKGNRQRNKNFTGFKAVNVNGANNPIPYNNMRINLTFLFVFQCLLFKSLVLIVKTLNKIISALNKFNSKSCDVTLGFGDGGGLVYITLDGGMCPTLDGNYIAPGASDDNYAGIIEHTYKNILGDSYDIYTSGTTTASTSEVFEVTGLTAVAVDPKSADGKNGDINGTVISGFHENEDTDEEEFMRITNQEDYFVKCVELQFAMEYEVIQFDFYNDWINGMIYIPRWFAEIRKNKDNAYYCGDYFNSYRMLTQQCALGYTTSELISSNFSTGCRDSKQDCHKRWGRKQVKIFGNTNKGIVTAQKNSKGQYAYYLRPNELYKRDNSTNVKANLFATDIVLLGSVLDCNEYGIPKIKGYTSSTYRMPPPTAEIISDTQEMNLSFIDKNKKEDVECSDVKTRITEGFVSLCNAFLTKKCGPFSIGTRISDCDPNYFAETLTQFIIGVRTEDCENLNSETKIIDFLKNYANGIKTGITAMVSSCVAEDARDCVTEASEYIFNDANIGNIARGIYYDITKFYSFNKKPVYESQLTNTGETTYSEISGIDWGYNPFDIDSGNTTDNTTEMAKQIAGHFLEIGCTFSLSNIKSCVNLQRICELGAEMSQSHYYGVGDGDTLLDPTGIISKREITDAGIRTAFATLNSKKLISTYDTENGRSRYMFTPYTPVSFMGELSGRTDLGVLTGITTVGTGTTVNYGKYNMIEAQSRSYKAFRFGVTSDEDKLFLIRSGNTAPFTYFMPQYDNSFYFYFGLRDGNTAIDRLYTEYYAPCETDNKEPKVTFTSTALIYDTDYNFEIKYNIENMSKIKSVRVSYNNKVLNSECYEVDYKNGTIKIKTTIKSGTETLIYDVINSGDTFAITLKDINGNIVYSTINTGALVKLNKITDTKFSCREVGFGDSKIERITGPAGVEFKNSELIFRRNIPQCYVTFYNYSNNVQPTKKIEVRELVLRFSFNQTYQDNTIA